MSEVDRARHLVDLGRHGDAVGILSGVLATHPDDAGALVVASAAYVGMGDRARALDAARAATRVAPDAVDSHMALWWACYRAGEYADAASAAREVVRLTPASARGQQALAVALSHLRRRRSEAVRAAEEAVRLDPASPDSWNALGYVWHGRRARKARAAYRRAMALDPSDAQIRQNLAALDVGRSPLAASRGLADALAMDPTSSLAKVNLERAVGGALARVFFVALVAFRAFFHDAETFSPARLLGFVLVVVPFAAWTYARLPRGVRHSLGSMLAPDLRANPVAAAVLAIGIGAFVAAFVADAHRPDEDPVTNALFVAGGLGFCGGAISLAHTMDKSRRDRERT